MYPLESKAWDNSGELGQRTLKYVTRHKWLQDQAITFVLKQRCRKYLSLETNNRRDRRDIHSECGRAVSSFKKYLEAVVVNKAPITASVVFPTELLKLLEDPKVFYYLETLETEFETIYQLPLTFNLWEHTLNIFGSKEKAILVIATLFQDISSTQIHLHWLQEYLRNQGHNFSEVSNANIHKLQKVTNEITLWTQGFTRKPSHVELYPSGAFSNGRYGNVQLYHYYVPSALTVLLEEEGHSSTLSVFIPFMFNYLYEVFRGSEIFKRISNEPQNIDDLGTLKDIYLGYEGSLLGSKTEFDYWNAEAFIQFIGANPFEFISSMIQDLKAQETQ